MSTTDRTLAALDLDIIAPSRQAVKIKSTLHPDAQFYELYYQSELSMEDIARLTTLYADMEPLVRILLEKEPFTPDQGKRFDAWLKEALGLMFATPLEAPVFEEMGYIAKWRVVQYFGLNCMDEPLAMQEMIAYAKEKEAEGATTVGNTAVKTDRPKKKRTGEK